MTRISTVLSIVLAALVLMALAVAASEANAAEFPTGTAEPWEYDPDNTGTAVAEWDDSGTILILQKNAVTSTNSAAGATLIQAAGDELDSISFDVKGYCNNGAPRFNVYWGEDWDSYNTGFFGCARSLDLTELEDGWTRVEFNCDSETGVPEEATGCGESILGVEIVMDEEGQTDLRNIVVNGMLYGPPVEAPEQPPTDTPVFQQSRVGYCMANPVARADGTFGRFVDLFDGQPAVDSRYAGAKYAYFIEGRGISCEVPQGYFLNGTSVGPYPFAKKA